MTRLAILGIDGATFEIIDPMVTAGELPNLARLFGNGGRSVLRSETPPITPPAWVSMMTGVNPGQHGVYNFVSRKLGSYQTPLTTSASYRGAGIADLLAKRGWSRGMVNVPMTYPPMPSSEMASGGFEIAGIPCPTGGASLFSDPKLEQLAKEILQREYRCDVDYSSLNGNEETPEDDLAKYATLRDELFAIERERLHLCRELLKRKSPDFFFVVLGITDRCQHWFWKFYDKSHPGWTEKGAELFGDTIFDAYRLADEFLGMVRHEIGSAVPMAVVSDHGFGPQTWDFHINAWLEQEGLLVRKKSPYWRICKRKFGPVPIPWLQRKTNSDAQDIDWSKTKAWCSLQGICLNVEGREVQGCVASENATALLQEIEQRLKLLRLPDGTKAIDYFVRGYDFYSGPRQAESPDLQFQMAGLQCLPKESWDSEQIFTPRITSGVSGTHRFEGVFAIEAPGVTAGSKKDEMHIRDTSPTLLYLLGEAIPSWMEGEIHQDFCKTQREPIIVNEEFPVSNTPSSEQIFTATDADEIEESLRGLGYL